MKRWTVSFLLAAVACTTLLLASCRNDGGGSEKSSTSPIGRVTLMSSVQDMSGLLYLADARGYFQEQGVEVVLADTASGVEAAKALAEGRTDFAMMSDFAFVRASFEEDQLVVLASLAETDNTELVCRQDRGIETPADLRGKRIGLKKSSAAEYFLGNYLLARGITEPDITLVDINADQLSEAVAAGEVDGVAAWWPITARTQQMLGDTAVSWPIQEGQKKFWLLVGRRDRLPAQPVLERFFTALVRAEEHLAARPEDGREAIRARLGLDQQEFAVGWAQTRLHLGLPREFLRLMEFEARWSVARGLVAAGKSLDFLERIHFEALDAVKPRAVTIIH